MGTLQNQSLPTTAMIGVGSMSGAILLGLLAPDVNIAQPIRATTQSAASAARLNELAGVEASAAAERPDANRVAVRGAKLVVLGVKPWAIAEVLEEIAPDLEPDAVVISVAAGVTLATMEAIVPQSVSVVRAMPNTPSLVGRGVTGLVAANDTPARALDLARSLFATVGEVITVDSEAKLDALSAISGSGPAYVFLFIEKLTAAAERLGFSHDDARKMVEGTFLGASLLLDHEGETPEELRRRVTSPKGTTERAIEVFQGAGLDAVIDEAIAQAIERARELAAGN